MSVMPEMSNPSQQEQPAYESSYRQIAIVAAYLLLLSVLIRLPHFFQIVIDWDESTFILMGQSVLEGHLPYTNLWDLKPPLLFLFFAGAIAVLGKSIVSVRFAGAICVALTALFTYLSGKKIWDHRTGIIGGTLFILASSIIPPAGQSVMSEHVATVPLVGALSLLVGKRQSLPMLFLSGMLVAIAAFTRLNLAYVSIMAGLFIVIRSFMENPGSILLPIKHGAAYACGGILILALVFLPYGLTGNGGLWWKSVILAPLNYAGSQLSFMEALGSHATFIRLAVFNAHNPLWGLNILMWACALAGIGVIILKWRNSSREKILGSALLLLFLAGAEISILKSGPAMTHYFIQIFPFMALSSSVFINAIARGYARWPVYALVFMALASSVLSVFPQYEDIASRIMSGKSLTYGPACEIAEFLKRENTRGEPIYMTQDHIVYWLIGAKPLTKATCHPSNISKDYIIRILSGPGATTEGELARVLALKPRFIVKKSEVFYLHDRPQARLLLDSALESQYEHVKDIQERQIYRRKK